MGLPPTDLKARTGLLTPPGMIVCTVQQAVRRYPGQNHEPKTEHMWALSPRTLASSKIWLDLSVLNVVLSATAEAFMARAA